jgi:hypothetical protein
MSVRTRSGSFKPRELRRRVVLPARVRDGVGWSSACILNISSRGMLLHSKSPAREGSLIELTHGHHVITARVVWRSGAKLGVAAEGQLPVEDLAAYAQPVAPPIADDGSISERRPRKRTQEENRLRSRLFEFACVAAIGATLATTAFGMVERAFAAPLELVQAVLGN